MELKQNSVNSFFFIFFLLIVPYGIETHQLHGIQKLLEELLIVPYGIETSFKYIHKFCNRLLIVPYGIETPYDGTLV